MSDRWPGLRRAFRVASGGKGTRKDVGAELAFHIEGRIDELMASGMSRADAEQEARARFGDLARIESEVERLERSRRRRRSIWDRVDTLFSDVRFAIRSVARQPVFALVIVATMTLGAGATAAIFHAIDRVVLHPVPYPDAERIVYLGMRRTYGLDAGAVTSRRFQFWREQSRVFEGLATARGVEATLNGADGDAVNGLQITGDYLSVVGARFTVGRAFLPADYADGASAAIISDRLWKREFGGNRDLVGKTLRLNDAQYTVVGVLSPDFEMAEEREAPDVLLPLVFQASQIDDGGANYMAIGKLRPTVTRTQLDADMDAVFARYRVAYPGVEADDRGVMALSFQQLYTGSLATVLWIFLGATAFVFVLACANVTNIVLARSIGRQREFAVRTALGAGRSRIVRQILLEMLVLGVVSATCATGASLLAVRWISHLGMSIFRRESQLHLDWRVVVFVTVIATAASMVIGGVVALITTRVDLANSLGASARSAGIGDRRGGLRSSLVAIESALAMVLLAGAGLLITSFVKVLNVDGGFRREGVYTARVSRTPRSYSDQKMVWSFDQRVLATLRATPGIQSAVSTATLPLRRGWNTPTTVEGRDEASIGGTEWRSVSPGYFRALGMTLLAGRDLAETDTWTSTPVVVVSKSYAAKLFPNENPIGRRIYIGSYKGKGKAKIVPSEIVGVVSDLLDRSLEQKQPRQTVWVSHAASIAYRSGPSVARGLGMTTASGASRVASQAVFAFRRYAMGLKAMASPGISRPPG